MISPEQRNKSPDLLSKVRMADTPRPVKRPNIALLEWRKVPKSIHLAYLLFITQDSTRELSQFQLSWISHFASKLDENQLYRAFNFFQELGKNEHLLQRTLPMINEAHRRVPRDGPPIREKRRIGIGYRDKGALRPLYQKREFGEESFWDGDIVSFLPFSYEVQGRWITTSEVKSLTGEIHFELLVSQLRSNSTAWLVPKDVGIQDHVE